MSTFNHAGIEIEVTATGGFRANVNGHNVVKTSLKALKDFIDKEANKKFVGFDAFIQPGIARTELRTIHIVGAAKSKNYSCAYDFVATDDATPTNRYAYLKVMPDTPQNRAAFLAVQEFEIETKRIREEREMQMGFLRAKIEYIKADDYMKDMKK